MHSSLSIIKENDKEGVDSDDAGSSQHLMRLFHALGPLVHAGPPLHPPTIYPAEWFCPPLDAHYSWVTPLSESAPSVSHTRISLLGARIPEEIFDYILEHMRPNVPTYRKVKKTKMSLSPGRDPISEEGLRTCAQVCRHWANKSRQYIFGGAILEISSSEDMEEFIQYAIHGCPLLVPLHEVIAGIGVLQRYDATRSFCHRLHSLQHATLDKLPVDMLEFLGPVPKSIPCHMLKTPHWSIPPTVTMPPSLLGNCDNVVVDNVHMASFSHAAQFVRHFSTAAPWPGSIRYDRVTWDDRKPIRHQPVFRRPTLSRRAYTKDSVAVTASSCTDNIRLVMHTVIARPTFIMHWMQEDERRWMFSLVVSFDQFLKLKFSKKCALHSNFFNFEDRQWPRIQVSWNLHVSPYPMDKHRSKELEVAFYLDRLPQDAPAFSVRVVGLEVVVPWEFGEPSCAIAFSELLAIVRSCPTRLIINFCFIDWKPGDLDGYLELYLPFNWNPQTEAHTVIFTALMFRLSELWERIDPVTLSPTGQTWQRHQDIIPSLVS